MVPEHRVGANDPDGESAVSRRRGFGGHERENASGAEASVDLRMVIDLDRLVALVGHMSGDPGLAFVDENSAAGDVGQQVKQVHAEITQRAAGAVGTSAIAPCVVLAPVCGVLPKPKFHGADRAEVAVLQSAAQLSDHGQMAVVESHECGGGDLTGGRHHFLGLDARECEWLLAQHRSTGAQCR